MEQKWAAFKKEIKPEPQRSSAISLAEAAKVLETKPIQPAYLPPGFQLQDIHNIKDRKNTIHLIYADGLLGFSIFETTDKRVGRRSERRRGSDVIEIEGTYVHKHQRGTDACFQLVEWEYLLLPTWRNAPYRNGTGSPIHYSENKRKVRYNGI